MAQVQQAQQPLHPLPPVPANGGVKPIQGAQQPPVLTSKQRTKDEVAEQIKREKQSRKYLESVGSDLRKDFKQLDTLMQEIAILLNDIQKRMEKAGLTGAVPAFKSFVDRNKQIQAGLRKTQGDYEKALKDLDDVLQKMSAGPLTKKEHDAKEALQEKRDELEREIQKFKDRDLLVKIKGTSESALKERLEALDEVAKQFGVDGTNVEEAVEAFNDVLAAPPVVQENLLAELHKMKAMQASLVSIQDEAAEIITHAKDPTSDTRKEAQTWFDNTGIAIKGLSECIAVADALNQLHELRKEADQRVDLICKSTKAGAALRHEIEGHAAQLRAAYLLSTTQLDASLNGQNSPVAVTADELREIGKGIAGDLLKMGYKALRSRKELHDEGENLFAKWNALQGKIEKLTQTRTDDWHRLDSLRKACFEQERIFRNHWHELNDWQAGAQGWDLSAELKQVAQAGDHALAFMDAVENAAIVVHETDMAPHALTKKAWSDLVDKKMPTPADPAVKRWQSAWILSMQVIQESRAKREGIQWS